LTKGDSLVKSGVRYTTFERDKTLYGHAVYWAGQKVKKNTDIAVDWPQKATGRSGIR